MEKIALIKELSQFLTQEPACVQTLGCLSEKAEIGIVVADTTFLTVQFKNNSVLVEEKKSYGADFIFHASPDAIEVLISEKALSPAQLGIKLFKQIISRDIQVSMPGSIFQIGKRGYLNILKVGGLEFLSELKKHNLASVPKIMTALKNLRKS